MSIAKAPALVLLAAVGLAACHHTTNLADAGGLDSSNADAAGNTPPTASIAALPTTLVGYVVTLPGAGTDADGDALTYAWTQTAGPVTAILTGADTATPSFRVPGAGTWTFALAVSDGKDTATASVSFDAWSIDGGNEFTVVIKPDGSVWSWGDNSLGQLGNPAVVTLSAVPVPVCAPGATPTNPADCAGTPLTGMVAVRAGAEHVVALRNDGTVWTWGSNGTRQLGTGPTAGDSATPVEVCADGATDDPCTTFLAGIQAISAGYLFSSAIDGNGHVIAWGENTYGELGQGTAQATNGPVTATGVPTAVCDGGEAGPCDLATGHVLSDVITMVSGGGGHSLALKTDGSLWGWGEDKNGQIGNGYAWADTGFSGKVWGPVQTCAAGTTAPCTSFFSGVVELDAWSALSVATHADGTLWAWGHNDYDQLAMDTSVTTNTDCINGSCSKVPVQICADGTGIPCTTPLTGVSHAGVGHRWVVIQKNDHTVWTWGYGAFGALGDGAATPMARAVPAQVCAAGATPPCTSHLGNVVGVATGYEHALALTADGKLWTWGDDTSGQLGDGASATTSAVPVEVSGF